MLRRTGRRSAASHRRYHVAFCVFFDQLLTAIEKLDKHGIETFGFGGYKTREPTVIGWMPLAQVYFRDPDGHMLEFISILPDAPNPGFIGPYSDWKKMKTSFDDNQT